LPGDYEVSAYIHKRDFFGRREFLDKVSFFQKVNTVPPSEKQKEKAEKEQKESSSNSDTNNQVTNYTGGRTQEELANLAKDPAHGDSIRPIDIEKGKHEAEIGLDLEQKGLLKKIVRDPSGKSEFIDEKGQLWDIKSFNSNYKPKKGGYRLDKAILTIEKSLAEKENVIIETTNMSKSHIQELKNEILKRGLENKIIYWP